MLSTSTVSSKLSAEASLVLYRLFKTVFRCSGLPLPSLQNCPLHVHCASTVSSKLSGIIPFNLYRLFKTVYCFTDPVLYRLFKTVLFGTIPPLPSLQNCQRPKEKSSTVSSKLSQFKAYFLYRLFKTVHLSRSEPLPSLQNCQEKDSFTSTVSSKLSRSIT